MKEKFLLHQSTKIHREKNKTKLQNWGRKQRSGQHTLACQKSIKQNKKTFVDTNKLFTYKLEINSNMKGA